MKYLTLLLPLALTGCIHFGEVKPEVRTVRIPCVEKVPDVPLLVHDNNTAATPINILYRDALLDREALRLYAGTLEEKIKPCVK